jgi:hypothetical protein
MIVYVFKTSVKTKKQVKAIASHLDGVDQITKWNFDLQDCDRILRVEAKNIESKDICKLMQKLDHDCVELN